MFMPLLKLGFLTVRNMIEKIMQIKKGVISRGVYM